MYVLDVELLEDVREAFERLVREEVLRLLLVVRFGPQKCGRPIELVVRHALLQVMAQPCARLLARIIANKYAARVTKASLRRFHLKHLQNAVLRVVRPANKINTVPYLVQ